MDERRQRVAELAQAAGVPEGTRIPEYLFREAGYSPAEIEILKRAASIRTMT
jgi:hypothetical protein